MESEALIMSDYNWCHGPKCHTHKTQDRIRGVKGSKVLRTKKISVNQYGYPKGVWTHFCSNGCWNDFMHEHLEEFIRLHPRTEALETPIEVKKEIVDTPYWGKQTRTTITPIDNA